MQAVLCESVCVVDDAGLEVNVNSALARNLRICEIVPEHDRKLAICGSGPSLRDYLDELRGWPGEIWAINGAYDYLVSNGIVPHGFVGLDPLPGLAEYVKNGRPKTTWYLASNCAPEVFDAVNPDRVMIWHSARAAIKVPKGQMIVGGGTSSITRSPFLAHMLGYRDMTVFGADSSFDQSRYCYGDDRYQCDSQAKVNWVQVGDEVFPSEICLIKQVSQFGVIAERYKGILKFKCGGLLDAFLRAPTMDDKDIEIESNAA
jgi:hypothetical protein